MTTAYAGHPWFGLLLVWLLMIAVMVAGWAWQRRHENIGIVDVLWSGGVGGSAVLLALLGDGAAAPRWLLALAGGVWGLRLALHLHHRVRGEDEDGRYRHMRKHWNGDQTKIFFFFQAQAVLVLLFALPFVAVARNGSVHAPWLITGVLVWLASVAGESLADRQLAAFRADPANKGKTCRTGLWRYSRHPNYFFEWLHWFAYVCFAAGSSLWWLTWSGPVVMYLFLRFISGIPFTEQQALRTRGDDYRRYQRDTPMLFPWFPKTASHDD